MQESYLGAPTAAASLSNLATLGDRLLGQILDSIVAIAAVALCAVPFVISRRIGTVPFLAGILFAIFYVLFADGFRNGQSYGKRIMKTAVVDSRTGRACTFGQSFVRNILLSILGVIDWVFIFGRKRQRLGDMAAKTVVIRAAS